MQSPRIVFFVAMVAVLAGLVAASERSSGAMASAATRFLAALAAEQRQQASFAFDASERLNWHYIPRERKGLAIKAMSDAQRKLARALLATGLSQRGYLTATSIMNLETVLGDLERRTGSASIVRDPELYFFSIFGTPSAHDTWGWRVEGHHISLNFTVVNGTLLGTSPTFFGTNPAEVKDGPQKGLRILGEVEDTARAVLVSLDAAQRKQAVIDGVAPKDIVTTNAAKVDPLSPVGINAGALDTKQRDLLMRVIDVYTTAMAADVAADRMAKLRRAGLEKIAFAWAGEAEHGKPHYYRIQGPTFLIEYDNTQNDANHIHSVWRDFDGDFGRDLLRDHLKTTPHQ
jgi:uncharacterized protein DUF3500